MCSRGTQKATSGGATDRVFRTALWQFAAFFMLLLAVWVVEVLDVPALVFGVPRSGVDFFGACILSTCVIVTAIVTVGHTYMEQRRMLSGLVVLCSKCHKIRVNPEVWQSVEQYISDRSRAFFSHGLCPECYATEVVAFEREVGRAEAGTRS